MSDRQNFEQLIQAEHHCIYIRTVDEQEVLTMVMESAAALGATPYVWSMARGLREGLVEGARAIANTDHPAAAAFHLRQCPWGTWAVMLDTAGHLKDERTLRELRETIEEFRRTNGYIILVDFEPTPDLIKAIGTPFEMSLPDEGELEKIAKEILRQRQQSQQVRIDMDRRTFDMVIKNLKGLSRRQARQIIIDAVTEDHRFDAHDLNFVLAERRKLLQGEGLLEYVESPVDMDQIGGLAAMKRWLRQRHAGFTDEAAAAGIQPPRGILLLGVQGAGKSLAAKAVATSWQRPLFRLDPGVLFDRYVGESERRLREALRQAEAMAPIVLWVDEIEKGFASAASQSTDGGLSKRMFGTLLTWMQEHKAPVFLVATANDIESLPPELLRKGRFDEIFFVDLPTPEGRQAIFTIHLQRRKQDLTKFDLPRLVDASQGYSGAEIEQAVIAALYDSFCANEKLTTGALVAALKNSPPLSVTMAEKVDELRQWAKGRCVPAD